MNDADWLRKHMRGKVQRAAVETESSRGLKQRVRKLAARVLRRLRAQPRDQPPSSSQAESASTSSPSEGAT